MDLELNFKYPPKKTNMTKCLSGSLFGHVSFFGADT